MAKQNKVSFRVDDEQTQKIERLKKIKGVESTSELMEMLLVEKAEKYDSHPIITNFISGSVSSSTLTHTETPTDYITEEENILKDADVTALRIMSCELETNDNRVLRPKYSTCLNKAMIDYLKCIVDEDLYCKRNYLAFTEESQIRGYESYIFWNGQGCEYTTPKNKMTYHEAIKQKANTSEWVHKDKWRLSLDGTLEILDPKQRFDFCKDDYVWSLTFDDIISNVENSIVPIGGNNLHYFLHWLDDELQLMFVMNPTKIHVDIGNSVGGKYLGVYNFLRHNTKMELLEPMDLVVGEEKIFLFNFEHEYAEVSSYEDRGFNKYVPDKLKPHLYKELEHTKKIVKRAEHEVLVPVYITKKLSDTLYEVWWGE